MELIINQCPVVDPKPGTEPSEPEPTQNSDPVPVCLSSGSTLITVTGTNLQTIQEPKVRAKYGGVETSNVRHQLELRLLFIVLPLRPLHPPLPLQYCTVVNDSTMTCLAPGLVYNKPDPPEGALRPDEFGFILDQVLAGF